MRIGQGLVNLFAFNWLYGFFVSFVLYYALNYFFPDRDTLIPCVVLGDRGAVLQAAGADDDDDVESGGGGDGGGDVERGITQNEMKEEESVKKAKVMEEV